MNWLINLALLSLLALGAKSYAQDQLQTLRRQFNQTAAAADSLVRIYGAEAVGRVMGERAASAPPNMKVVLLFWADDEAEVFLNGFSVGQTRLTPVRVEIPPLYLRQQNQLEAHCWDTERVESGFMAGVYLEDPQGTLYPILTTKPNQWRTSNGRAQAIYYTHTLPDIPGAQVIWGDLMFGQVKLQASFSNQTLQRARWFPGPAAPATAEQPMQTQEILGRLAKLQQQRQDLAQRLAHMAPKPTVPYEGGALGLALALGKAPGPVAAGDRQKTAALASWVERQSAGVQRLMLRPSRPLRGSSAATQAQAKTQGGANEQEDRRVDYQPPPEKRVANGDQAAAEGSRPQWQIAYQERVRQALRSRLTPRKAVLLALLLTYVGGAGYYWSQLFNNKGWTA